MSQMSHSSYLKRYTVVRCALVNCHTPRIWVLCKANGIALHGVITLLHAEVMSNGAGSEQGRCRCTEEEAADHPRVLEDIQALQGSQICLGKEEACNRPHT